MTYISLNLSGFRTESVGIGSWELQGNIIIGFFLLLLSSLESLSTKNILLTVGISEVPSQILHDIPGQRIRILVVLLKIK